MLVDVNCIKDIFSLMHMICEMMSDPVGASRGHEVIRFQELRVFTRNINYVKHCSFK